MLCNVLIINVIIGALNRITGLDDDGNRVAESVFDQLFAVLEAIVVRVSVRRVRALDVDLLARAAPLDATRARDRAVPAGDAAPLRRQPPAGWTPAWAWK